LAVVVHTTVIAAGCDHANASSKRNLLPRPEPLAPVSTTVALARCPGPGPHHRSPASSTTASPIVLGRHGEEMHCTHALPTHRAKTPCQPSSVPSAAGRGRVDRDRDRDDHPNPRTPRIRPTDPPDVITATCAIQTCPTPT
jgi:hypothetical protein